MILEICRWLEAQHTSVAIAASPKLFPILETVHVLAISLVVGSIATLDLRLIGAFSRASGVRQLARTTLPWTWGGFCVAAVAGSLMFASRATWYYDNAPFRWKLLFLLLAGINMATFHLTAYRHVDQWNDRLPPPNAARAAGYLSLGLWIGVVFFGRFAGFVNP